jgi:hypothetical protein
MTSATETAGPQVPAGAQPGSGAYRVMLGLAGAVAGVILLFFLWGTADGTVSSYNIGLWLVLLAVPAGILWGATALRRQGRTGISTLLLALLGVPGVLAAALIVFLSLTVTSWH